MPFMVMMLVSVMMGNIAFTAVVVIDLATAITSIRCRSIHNGNEHYQEDDGAVYGRNGMRNDDDGYNSADNGNEDANGDVVTLYYTVSLCWLHNYI